MHRQLFKKFKNPGVLTWTSLWHRPVQPVKAKLNETEDDPSSEANRQKQIVKYIFNSIKLEIMLVFNSSFNSM